MLYTLGGIGKIDIEDWKSHTRLKHCNTESPVVKWFWEIINTYSEEMRARLLQFVTGSSRVTSHQLIVDTADQNQTFVLGPLARFQGITGLDGSRGSPTVHAPLDRGFDQQFAQSSYMLQPSRYASVRIQRENVG